MKPSSEDEQKLCPKVLSGKSDAVFDIGQILQMLFNNAQTRQQAIPLGNLDVRPERAFNSGLRDPRLYPN
jgi:hypothetical protein